MFNNIFIFKEQNKIIYRNIRILSCDLFSFEVPIFSSDMFQVLCAIFFVKLFLQACFFPQMFASCSFPFCTEMYCTDHCQKHSLFKNIFLCTYYIVNFYQYYIFYDMNVIFFFGLNQIIWGDKNHYFSHYVWESK